MSVDADVIVKRMKRLLMASQVEIRRKAMDESALLYIERM